MQLSKLPRNVYTPEATPLESLPTLSKALGGKVNIFIKRDDKLGLTGGGNKTRKLEFVIADAQRLKADIIITCGAVQSNHCRLTLSACVKEGLPCALVLEERVPNSYKPEASGNNYLFHLLGAHQIIKVGNGESGAMMVKLAEQLKQQGFKNPYIVPGGASNELGATGYASCAAEVVHQVFQKNLSPFTAVVVPSGSGGTHAGFLVGMHALRQSTPVIGVSTRHPEPKQKSHIFGLATKVAAFLEVPAVSEDQVVVKDQYVGPGYSLPTDGMREAVTLFARTEGILLDPVYSGKAAAGLVDMVRNGTFPAGSNVLFLHTGGAPTMYHYMPLQSQL